MIVRTRRSDKSIGQKEFKATFVILAEEHNTNSFFNDEILLSTQTIHTVMQEPLMRDQPICTKYIKCHTV